MGIVYLFVKNNIVPIILLAVISYVLLLRHQNGVLVESNDKLSASVISLTADKAQLQDDLNFQNDAVSKLKTDSDRRRENGIKVVNEGRQTASIYKQRATSLASTVLSTTPATDCTQATKLINSEIEHARN